MTRYYKDFSIGDIKIPIYIIYDESAKPGENCWFKMFDLNDALVFEGNFILPEVLDIDEIV